MHPQIIGCKQLLFFCTKCLHIWIIIYSFSVRIYIEICIYLYFSSFDIQYNLAVIGILERCMI